MRFAQPKPEPPLHVEWGDPAKILDARGNIGINYFDIVPLLHSVSSLTYVLSVPLIFVYIGEGDLRHITRPKPILSIVIAKPFEAQAQGRLAHFKVDGENSKLE